LSTDDLDCILTEIDFWIQRQSSDRNQNPTLSLRDLNKPKLPAGQEFFPIFTSSIDEEMSCPNWSNDNVRSLTERTIKAAKLAALKGLYPVVVIHPNTLNKKWHDLSLIYSELKKQDVEISLPWHQISSYEYLEVSRVIATWRSTIGLEAVLKDKEVVLLSDTVYDELIDFQSLSSIDFSNLVTNRRNFLDILLAKLTIHYYTNFGYDLFVDLSSAEIEKIQTYEKLLPLGGIVRSIQNKVRKYLRPLRVYGATPREVFDFLSLFMPRQKVDLVMKFLITNYQY
jgi:hypothetical protein